MPDERQESTKQGIAPAPESAIGRNAAEQVRAELTHTPADAQPDSAMGGTSDNSTAADEAWSNTGGQEDTRQVPGTRTAR